MAFFGRLEIEILLRALDLRPFLIGRSAIRNWVVGFGWRVVGVVCREVGFGLLVVATAVMAQNTDRMIA